MVFAKRRHESAAGAHVGTGNGVSEVSAVFDDGSDRCHRALRKRGALKIHAIN